MWGEGMGDEEYTTHANRGVVGGPETNQVWGHDF